MSCVRTMRTVLVVLPMLGLLGLTAPGQTVRIPAEWEPHEATWMQWPKGIETSYRPNFAGIIDVIQDYEPVNLIVQSVPARNQAQSYLLSQGVPLSNLNWHIMPYDWAWVRDNGPVWAVDNGEMVAQDWGFDAWGGGVVPYWDQDDAVPCQIAAIESVSCDPYDLIHERGSLEFNGTDTVIVSWPVFSDRNPTWSQADIEAVLVDAFGVTNVIWLLTAPASDQFTGGHVDGIARFIDEDRVVVARYVDQSDPDAAAFEEAAQIIADAGLEVVRLDVPGYVTYFGFPMPANYVNWLVGNGFVLMTGFGYPAWDNAAKATVETLFPGREVHVVECLEIWYWGGGVHCVTNDQPALLETLFIRGDANGDGALGIADAVANLAHLFQGVPASCEKALDSNDDGAHDIADPVYELAYLFTTGTTIPAPFPDCGPDPSADSLTCSTFAGCP